ncbi:Mitochondrial 37S ribosomal protein NAM9 [Trichophyton interdigitale]|uniref:Small ribosomal subunit protein uS4m n=1 Tax=Trichophyton interdigitale TaxID=101480 RepID=A0A9P5CVT3_9EURO|nr:Mitochondrial 37S ribosomal protein NAM9 [Trichophyton interdigitale]KAF3897648.1 Mitochondrial 37S ribosomal protein NAM9 [Trichophyton interdigitale]KAG8209032.1 Mitochondrial 37S ribosomal protein NAM9 [Trichophyton interdigitale]
MRNKATSYLRKPKIRQSWSKYNLFNITQVRLPYTKSRTFFQQKWSAKSLARGYHGEQVRESQWERMFSRRLRAVVPMDPFDLARNDGSKNAAGRGSGMDKGGREDGRQVQDTPYMLMTFAPLETRLDVAIFRAMFASSTRQARQFVIHGGVTVNGKKMQYPGYLLNPGDMFQVDPERVMYATGAPKDKSLRRAGRLRRRMGAKSKEEKDEEGEEAKAEDQEQKKEESKEDEDPRQMLKELLSGAKGIMTSSGDLLPAKRRQAIRAFQRSVKQVLSRSSTTTTMTDNLEAQFLTLKNMIDEDTKRAAEAAKRAAAKKAEQAAPSTESPSSATEPSSSASPTAPSPSSTTPNADTTSTTTTNNNDINNQTSRDSKASSEIDDLAASLSDVELADYSPADLKALKLALEEIHENPIDSTKPYATPWRPRDYMSPFAFVPRYLEVNHNICAAVYLRHPVARPGRAEVPTPFNETIGGAAFAWYLRRR